MKSFSKNARISAKKMNLIAGMVRGEKVNDALNQLKFTPKKAAKILYKVVFAAVSNAKNNYDQNEDNLFVKSIMVNKGITLKRGLPVSRGRYHPVLKRNTHITVEVGMIDPTQVKKTKSKPAKTEAVTETSKETSEAPAKKTAAKKSAPKKTAPKKTAKKTENS